MNIREATLKDLKDIGAILVQSSKMHYEQRRDIFKETIITQSEKMIKESIKSKEIKVIVAEESDQIKGVVIYKIREVKDHTNLSNTTTLWVSEICVDESCRSQGIGKQLMDYLKGAAKEENCSRIELNCWEFNERARKFYEENGLTTQRRIMEIEI